MRVINSLLGSLIGAVAGTGIYFLLEALTGQKFLWFPIIYGLLIGITARNFGGECGLGARYFCGAIAGIVACAAIFGVEFLPGWIEEQKTKSEVDFSAPIIKQKLEIEQSRISSEQGSSDSSDAGENADEQESGTSTSEATETEEAEQGEKVEVKGNEFAGGGTETKSEDEGERDPDINSRRDQGRDAPAGVGSTASTEKNERIAELIRKKNHQTWYEKYLHFIVGGVGVFLAYQSGKGFGGNDAA